MGFVKIGISKCKVPDANNKATMDNIKNKSGVVDLEKIK